MIQKNITITCQCSFLRMYFLEWLEMETTDDEGKTNEQAIFKFLQILIALDSSLKNYVTLKILVIKIIISALDEVKCRGLRLC